MLRQENFTPGAQPDAAWWVSAHTFPLSSDLPTKQRCTESRVTGEIASELPSSLTVQICILIRLSGIQLPDPKFLSLIPSKDATETDQKPKGGAEQSPAGLSLQEISHWKRRVEVLGGRAGCWWVQA